MDVSYLWDQYTAARRRFEQDPSPENEGKTVGAYAEWARKANQPAQAHEMISCLCFHLKWIVDDGLLPGVNC